MALIPKKVGAVELNEFRPISLIGNVYKIIANLVAKRPKKVIHILVDGHQMAFIRGRHITDAILIANERIEARQRSKVTRILCKLDIQKAYDHLNWFTYWEFYRRFLAIDGSDIASVKLSSQFWLTVDQ